MRFVAETRCDGVPYACRICMKRTLRIRIAFEPTRLSAEWLQGAFDLVLPIRRHPIGDELAAEMTGIHEPAAGRGSVKERS